MGLFDQSYNIFDVILEVTWVSDRGHVGVMRGARPVMLMVTWGHVGGIWGSCGGHVVATQRSRGVHVVVTRGHVEGHVGLRGGHVEVM